MLVKAWPASFSRAFYLKIITRLFLNFKMTLELDPSRILIGVWPAYVQGFKKLALTCMEMPGKQRIFPAHGLSSKQDLMMSFLGQTFVHGTWLRPHN